MSTGALLITAARTAVLGVVLQAAPNVVLLRALTKYSAECDRALAERQKAAVRQRTRLHLLMRLFGFARSVTVVGRPLPPPVSKNALTLSTIAYAARIGGFLLATLLDRRCPITALPVVIADVAALSVIETVREQANEARELTEVLEKVDGVTENRGFIRSMLGLRTPERIPLAYVLLPVAGATAAVIAGTAAMAAEKQIQPQRIDWMSRFLVFSTLLEAAAIAPQLASFKTAINAATDDEVKRRLWKMKSNYAVAVLVRRAACIAEAAVRVAAIANTSTGLPRTTAQGLPFTVPGVIAGALQLGLLQFVV